MARKISTLKQLRTALRSISLSEFMQLTRQGRIAYGALFDELEDSFQAEEEPDAPSLPAPEEIRRLPSSPPTGGASLYPREGFCRLQPPQEGVPIAPWVAMLAMMGVDNPEAYLAGQRELWARGGALQNLRMSGLAFSDPPDTARQPNLGADLYLG